MERFRYLEHTADILFEAFGRSFPEALENAAYALFHTVGEAKEKEERVVEARGANKEELVVFFLANLLTEMDINEMVFCRCQILECDEKRNYVKAKAWGEKVRPKQSVKGVTFHELAVEQNEGGWRIRVLLDV